MPQKIQIITINPQGREMYAEPVEQARINDDRRQKPEPVISVYPGVLQYGTPEFFEFAARLNEKLNNRGRTSPIVHWSHLMKIDIAPLMKLFKKPKREPADCGHALAFTGAVLILTEDGNNIVLTPRLARRLSPILDALAEQAEKSMALAG